MNITIWTNAVTSSKSEESFWFTAILNQDIGENKSQKSSVQCKTQSEAEAPQSVLEARVAKLKTVKLLLPATPSPPTEDSSPSSFFAPCCTWTCRVIHCELCLCLVFMRLRETTGHVQREGLWWMWAVYSEQAAVRWGRDEVRKSCYLSADRTESDHW